jgi:uncharacterized protein YrrD
LKEAKAMFIRWQTLFDIVGVFAGLVFSRYFIAHNSIMEVLKTSAILCVPLGLLIRAAFGAHWEKW